MQFNLTSFEKAKASSDDFAQSSLENLRRGWEIAKAYPTSTTAEDGTITEWFPPVHLSVNDLRDYSLYIMYTNEERQRIEEQTDM